MGKTFGFLLMLVGTVALADNVDYRKYSTCIVTTHWDIYTHLVVDCDGKHVVYRGFNGTKSADLSGRFADLKGAGFSMSSCGDGEYVFIKKDSAK